ncbi:hypothetical protein [Chitinophaga varians]|uniref:hypothetical protein n=1 Tax=Chitinophaga varians TaxID=2202339 RepID=UPI00165EF7DF|nr:hypothetical protein [Chitinophaga varians]MBC9912758.1 hypothetical protein [Chitinophaga varians]
MNVKHLCCGILFLSCITFGTPTKAQEKQRNYTIKKHKKTGTAGALIVIRAFEAGKPDEQPLVGVNLILDADTTKPSRSIGYEGVYKLQVRPGKHKIWAGWPGYKAITTGYISANPGDSILLNFYLSPDGPLVN